MQRSRSGLFLAIVILTSLALLVAGCGSPAATPTPVPPTAAPPTAVPPTAIPTKAPAAPTAAPTAAVIPTQAAAAGQFTDPFSYCAAVGTLDKPDTRYTGANPPDAVLTGLRAALKIGDAMPADQLAKSTFWRCMGGKVYACNVGANIPCSAKAITDKTPTQAMKDFCTANPKSDFLPAAVTGRETVYSWKCTDGAPAIDKELTKPDAAGFLSMFWYEIARK